MRNQLKEAVQGLPERYRLVLLLYYFEQMPFEDIALCLDVTPAQAMRMHTEALRVVKKQFKDSAR